MTTPRISVGDLHVDPVLHRFVAEEALVGTGLGEQEFWDGASTLIHSLAPRNRELLERRTHLQKKAAGA